MSIETSTDRSDEEQTENSRSDASARPGTVTEPSEQLPDFVDISGLDTEQAARLREQGIKTIQALEVADSETIAEFANVSVEQAVDWLEQARDLESETEAEPEEDVDTDGEEATDEIPSEPPSTFRATIQSSAVLNSDLISCYHGVEGRSRGNRFCPWKSISSTSLSSVVA
ncbi:helix-hairpin-helix domain-containing protein [Halorubrum laminariae]|uniref:Helix-hairpin-helix domain-containing protein n=1 Tax=Halorubrum laminariae TaxID=1433523 RepID=A0ABD6C521_9EURY